MRVKITDFLMAMGKICDDDMNSCQGCPMQRDFRETDGFSGCVCDYMANPKYAEIVKNEVLKYIKAGGLNDTSNN